MGAKVCRVILPDPCNEFATDLITVIVDKEYSQNAVYSPASIHACLTLGYAGAGGQTAEEMRKVLYLSQDGKEKVLQKYKKFLKSSFESFNSSDDAPQLKMAIRLYVNKGLRVTSKFNKIAGEYFEAKAKRMDFKKNQEAVENINHWVEQQTENKIKNLLQPDAVNADTTAVLVNGIYFKAKWLRPFNKDYTMKAPFYMDNNQQTEVEMMFTKDSFGYGELPRLKATALVMPYKDSNISMLIILPNDRDGLKTLGKQLITLDFYGVSEMISTREVRVFLPKFSIEYNMDLKETLKKMGINSMFDEAANFSGLFKKAQNQKISDVKHKVFLDVNEAGSEAAVATTQTFLPLSAKLEDKEFRADHPFFFAIRSENTVYFAGHVAKF